MAAKSVKIKAQAKWVKIAVRKVRLMIDLIRGKSVNEAQSLLAFMPQKAAGVVADVLKAAVANARHNYKVDGDLFVSEAFADEATFAKRWQPVSRGRAHAIKKRSSHITVCVSHPGEEI
ncbi:MAG: 50S ribosomal protein L22 [Candidatus Margulisiibacteriota bacterium]